jgi:DNA-binding Lrp family transcriptional regulator
VARNKRNRVRSLHAKVDKKNNSNNDNNGVYDSPSPKQASKKLFDSISLKIISELLRNPTIRSLSLAKKVDVPLSTLQRRRARIEKAILKKTYDFNYKAFGARVGDLIINVDKGRSDEVAQSILKKYKNNVTYCHTRIDLVHSVLAHVIYKNTEELFYLIEDIKAMQYVNSLSWSEMVNVMGDNDSEVIRALFNK